MFISSMSKPKHKPISILEKKITPNPKYLSVQSVVDSGCNTKRYKESITEAHRHFRFHPDEIFNRVTLCDVVKLITEVSALHHDKRCLEEILANDRKHSESAELNHKNEEECDGYNDESFVTKEGECQRVTQVSKFEIQTYGEHNTTKTDDPYLLLDTRESCEFDNGHITTAFNYPLSRLNRAINSESALIWKFKNMEDGIIIVYDNDEMIASKFATILVQRGYDNVYMLSGGLNLAKMRFPEHLIIEDCQPIIPIDSINIIRSYIDRCPKDDPATSRSKMTARSATSGTRFGRNSTRQSISFVV